MIEKNSEMLEEMESINKKYDSEFEPSTDEIFSAEDNEITLDDLGEVVEEETPQMTPDQMKKFMSYVNGKVNQFKHREKKLTQRRNKNKLAKKSRKKNRK